MRILHIEDSIADAELIGGLIAREWPDCRIVRVATRPELTLILEAGEFDVILSDFSMGGFDGLAALELSRKLCPDKPFIFVSGTLGEDRAAEALKAGAADYIVKDRLGRLIPAIRGALARAEDAARHRRTAAALRESEDRIREQATLLDKAQDAILASDLDNRITYWNQGAARLYGWTAEEALGRDAIELLAVESRLHHAARARTLSRNEWRGELRHRTKGGGEVIVASSWTLVRRDGRSADALLVINTDVTERKRFESQLLRAQRLESIGLMVGGIAHDLNNVFSPIVMALDLLRPMVPGPGGAKLIGSLESSSKYGAALVEQLLAFARGAEGRHADMDLRVLAAEIGPLARTALPHAISVEIALTAELPTVRADATQLKQVLMNLCLNARDAMPDGGRILLEFGCAELKEADARLGPDAVPGTYAVISVADTGPGIPPEHLDRIFDPFFTTKAHGKGTGLGLSTVLGIVKGHDGLVSVDSEPGRGATFRIFLPSASTASSISASGAKALPAAAAGVSRDIGILLVDDDPSVLRTLELLLNSWGYRVFSASDGPRALTMLSEHRSEINLAVTDLQIGSMTGIEFVRLVRQHIPGFPVVAISGFGESGRFNPELKAAGVPLVGKPIRRESLIDAITFVMHEQNAASAPASRPQRLPAWQMN